jgi:tRNA dimethylallyltransferase
MRLTGKLPPLVVILGATASGKTSLSLTLAKHLRGEIVNADSRQIYRGMDIGTAKATPAQQQAVPHHLLDLVNPDENPGLAEYQALAYRTIEAIQARGSLPVLVGGTGQYITAVVEGWSIPRVQPNLALRAELEDFAQQQGQQALHQRLAQVDAEAASAIHPNNTRRIIRALEVYLESGTPFSELQRKTPPPYRILTIGLHMNRERLYERADRRVDEMIQAGFVDEVRGLLAQSYTRDLPSMTSLGYAELAAHLLDNVPLEEAIQKTKYNTHDFIRRQEVWFRGHDTGILWHNVEEINVERLLMTLRDWTGGDPC